MEDDLLHPKSAPPSRANRGKLKAFDAVLKVRNADENNDTAVVRYTWMIADILSNRKFLRNSY